MCIHLWRSSIWLSITCVLSVNNTSEHVQIQKTTHHILWMHCIVSGFMLYDKAISVYFQKWVVSLGRNCFVHLAFHFSTTVMYIYPELNLKKKKKKVILLFRSNIALTWPHIFSSEAAPSLCVPLCMWNRSDLEWYFCWTSLQRIALFLKFSFLSDVVLHGTRACS